MRGIKLGLLVALSASIAGTGITGGSGGRAAAAEAPFLAAGTVTNSAGTPMPGAEVIARVEHYDPEMHADVGIPVARTVADGHGHFELRGSLGNTPATVNQDGTIPVDIAYGDAADGQEYMLQLSPPTAGRPYWSWGNVPDAGLLPAAARAHAAEQASQALRSIDLRVGMRDRPSNADPDIFATPTSGGTTAGPCCSEPSVTPTPTVGSTSSGSPSPSPTPEDTTDYAPSDYSDPDNVDPSPTSTDEPLPDTTTGDTVPSTIEGSTDNPDAVTNCYQTIWYDLNESDNTVRRRYVPFYRARILNHAIVKYEWENAAETEASIAITVDGKYVKGGLSYARDKGSTVNYHFDTSDNQWTYWSGYFKGMLEYRKQALYCQTSPQNVGYPVDTGKRRWRPHHFRVSNKNYSDISSWTCNDAYKDTIQNETWVSQTLTNRYNGFYEIFGAKLDLTQKKQHDAQSDVRASTGGDPSDPVRTAR